MNEFAVWAFFAAGLGRLSAKDSVARVPRNWALRRLVSAPRSMADVAEGCREESVVARSPVRGWVAEGLSCPSCSAFWWLLAARLVVHPRRLLSRRGVVELFGWWGAAATITRAVP